MKKLINYLVCFPAVFILLFGNKSFGQTEEIHIFYVDYSEFRDPVLGFTSILNNMAKEDAYNKAKFCVDNNWKTMLYVPKSTFGTIDTVDKKIVDKLSRPPSSNLGYSLDYEYDAVQLRDYIYKCYDKYGKFISLNLYFYFPPHSARKFVNNYNGLKNFLLDELATKGLLTEVVNINFNVVSSDEKLSKKIKSDLSEKSFKLNFFFLNNDPSYTNTFNDVKFKNY